MSLHPFAFRVDYCNGGAIGTAIDVCDYEEVFAYVWERHIKGRSDVVLVRIWQTQAGKSQLEVPEV